MELINLPHDILLLLLQYLPLKDLYTLSCVSKAFYHLIDSFGWSLYRHLHPRLSFSLTKARSRWSARETLKYDTLSDRSWNSPPNFAALPLSKPWRENLQPTLVIGNERVIVAAGHVLYSYRFHADNSVLFEGRRNMVREITACSLISESPEETVIVVGFRDGALEQISIGPPSRPGRKLKISIIPYSHISSHLGNLIEFLSYEGRQILSLSSNGNVTLTSTSFTSTSVLSVGERSWTSYLCMHSSTPFIAVGTSSLTPMKIHSIADGEICKEPTAVVSAEGSSGLRSAVYGICNAPPASPWGSSPHVLVAGWYDGHVRCYDLRSGARTASDGNDGPRTILPVLSMADTWMYDPIYSVSAGGGSASYIAAGSARHSVVSFWDVRSPSQGWSVHAPGNDRSPVYDIVLESSRLFGVTQKRPFVYDFGPSSTYQSYPDVGGDLVYDKEERGFYVTQYNHNRRQYTRNEL